MIRVRRLNLRQLGVWLVHQQLVDTPGHYGLSLWREEAAGFAALRDELREYIDEAFADARQRLRHGFEDSLSPFDEQELDPAANYPAMLNRTTLWGYFGETLGVIAVEHWGAVGYSDWQVPAFLFRFHDQEFQHLEQINERIRGGERYDPDAPGQRRPGRTGDDALAFRCNPDGSITDVLTMEAKCLRTNSTTKIKEAHEKLAVGGPLPSGIRELIELLSDYDTPAAKFWREALLRLRAGGFRTANRYDGVVYATEHVPARGSRQAWLPLERHSAYPLSRHLEAMEFQFEDLDHLINRLYRSEQGGNTGSD